MDTKQSEIYRQWEDGFMIRRMRQDEGQQVTKFSATAKSVELEVALGVCEDYADDNDRSGYYVGELNGEIVASIAVTQVADDLKCVSNMYVADRYRKTGLAVRMIEFAREVIYRHQNFTGVIGLDAFGHLQPMYEKLGGQATTQTLSYQGVVSADDVDRNRSEADKIRLPVQKPVKLLLFFLPLFSRTVVPGGLMFYCGSFSFFSARSPSSLGQPPWNFAT